MIRPCRSCGVPFESPWSGHFYCSPLCIYEAHVVRHALGCWEWRGVKSRTGYGKFHTPRIQGTERKPIHAHRFSYEVNFGPIPEGLFVLHKCDNPACTRPDHLWVGSIADNVRDSMAKGRNSPPPRPPKHFANTENFKRGSEHYAARLTANQVHEIRRSTERGVDLAARLGVAQTTISMIRRGRTWRHLAIGNGDRPQPSLTEDAVRAIRSAWGEASSVLAERYGVSPRQIRKVRSGEQWKHVT